MKLVALTALLAITFQLANTACAQDFPKPTAEHKWLEQFVGEWETEATGVAGPDQPEMKCKGEIKSRMLGGFWVISEAKTDMMGTAVNAIQTIGYDAEKKAYVGTWVDSMLNHMWKYEGAVDKTGKILTLEAEGPNFFAEGKKAKFRDVYEFKDKDHIVVSSQMQGEDGKWVTFMNGSAKRVK